MPKPVESRIFRNYIRIMTFWKLYMIICPCCQQFSLMSLLWSGSLRVIMFATFVWTLQIFANSWTTHEFFFSRSNWSEIKDSCVALRKDICSSCKGSCLGIRFILCSIPSFYWWTLFENHQKCLIWIFMPKLYFADIYFGGIRVQLRK